MKQKSLQIFKESKTQYLKLIIIFIILVYFIFSYFTMINYIELLVILRVNENKSSH